LRPLLPNLQRFTTVKHSYIIELKFQIHIPYN
jgi:hypothetical protein